MLASGPSVHSKSHLPAGWEANGILSARLGQIAHMQDLLSQERLQHALLGDLRSLSSDFWVFSSMSTAAAAFPAVHEV